MLGISIFSLPKFLLFKITTQLPGEVPEGRVAERKPIVVTKLSKLQGSEERENKNCGNQVAKNVREKKKENCGNQVTENLGRNLIVIQAMKLPKMRGKKEDLGRNLKEKNIVAIDLWQWNC